MPLFDISLLPAFLIVDYIVAAKGYVFHASVSSHGRADPSPLPFVPSAPDSICSFARFAAAVRAS